MHVSRSSKTGKMNITECEVCDDRAIPHGSDYQQFLANAHLKRLFLHYLMHHFIRLSCSKSLPIQIVIYYDDINNYCPIGIYNGEQMDLPMLKNENGEADYNVWYHCMMSTSRHIILGSDTGIWNDLSGIWLARQQTVVCIGSEYVHINTFQEAAYTHPKHRKSFINFGCHIFVDRE